MADSTGNSSAKRNAIGFFAISMIVFAAVWPLPAPAGYDPTRYAINALSHGTSIGNLFSSVICLIAALRILAGRKSKNWFSFLRGAATFYLFFTLLAYSLLMMHRPYIHDGGFDWRDFVLHCGDPLFMICWWLIYPPQKPISAVAAFLWLIPGALYLAYIYIRGAYINWYPYGFLSPAEHTGFGLGKILLSVVLIFILLAQIVAWMSRVNRGRSSFQ